MTPDLRTALLAALKDRNGPVRGSAVSALSSSAGEASVRTALLAALKDDDEDVCMSAVQALEGWIAREKFARPAT